MWPRLDPNLQYSLEVTLLLPLPKLGLQAYVITHNVCKHTHIISLSEIGSMLTLNSLRSFSWPHAYSNLPACLSLTRLDKCVPPHLAWRCFTMQTNLR